MTSLEKFNFFVQKIEDYEHTQYFEYDTRLLAFYKLREKYKQLAIDEACTELEKELSND